jgi:N-acyl-L-homoserine lactone synthetase
MQDGVRFATTKEEKQAIYKLRYQVFVEEEGWFANSADHERHTFRDEYDALSRLIIAIKGGTAVGTMRLLWGGDAPFPPHLRKLYLMRKFEHIVRDDQICLADRLMVSHEMRGGMLTFTMLCQALNFMLQRNVELVLVVLALQVDKWLARWLNWGFRQFAPSVSLEGVGQAIPLAGIVWDIEHLTRVDSPIVAAVKDGAEKHAETVRQLVQVLNETVPVGGHA